MRRMQPSVCVLESLVDQRDNRLRSRLCDGGSVQPLSTSLRGIREEDAVEQAAG